MCGIAGYAHFDGSQLPSDVLSQMCRVIAHRGPDDQGIGRYDGVAMGMQRLAIIDLAGGNQPIESADGQFAITFNGELYNYQELRRELVAVGAVFRTQSDTEVVLQGFMHTGPAFLDRMRGMFAFSLLDRAKQKLYLVRDQIGVKPLYYCNQPGALVWGSEIKSLLVYPGVPRALNTDALAEFLRWEYVPAPKTLFNGIHKLEPAQLLELDLRSGTQQLQEYWQPPAAGADSSTRAEHVDKLAELIEHSVHQRLVADVPLGAFLSGGVDSSLVVSHMGEASTFSIGFDDPSYNELAYAKDVAAALGVSHRYEVLDPQVAQYFDELMYFYDDPIADFSIFPTYLVSRLTRESVTVALSGDGGDELFAGYDTVVAQNLARRIDGVPDFLKQLSHRQIFDRLPPQDQKKGLVNKLKRFAEGFAQDPALGHSRWRRFADDQLLGQLLPDQPGSVAQADQHIAALFAAAPGDDWVNQALYVDFKSYLADNCLTKVDRSSMAVSLESRVPLLDLDLVNYAFALPGDLKMDAKESKSLLKAVAAKRVPEHCVYRTKQGFSIPIKQWLGGQFKPIMDRYLCAERLSRQGLFDPKTVTQLIGEHLSQKANHSHILWGLIVFQAWHDRWLTGDLGQ
ncbi:MAG: asparagine synthase (glutamine-hydrolyzing) [Pseudomonadales bacterium]